MNVETSYLPRNSQTQSNGTKLPKCCAWVSCYLKWFAVRVSWFVRGRLHKRPENYISCDCLCSLQGPRCPRSKKKCACVSSLTTSWKRPLTDCFHRKTIPSRGNTLPQVKGRKALTPTVHREWIPAAVQISEKSLLLLLLRLLLLDVQTVCGNGGHDGCKMFFEVRSNISGEVEAFIGLAYSVYKCTHTQQFM